MTTVLTDSERLVLRMPNWLGDAVMALPAAAAVRAAFPATRIAIAAPASIAPLFEENTIARQDEIVVIARRDREASELEAGSFDTVVLFPNSLGAAWVARQAGIPARWGYAAGLRRLLLTRAVARPSEVMHQSAYYLALVRGLGLPAPDRLPSLALRPETLRRAHDLLARRGLHADDLLVGFAPGAAYGHAKRWPPARVAELITRVSRERHAVSVLVGSGGDRGAGREIESLLPPDARVVNLIGRTDLRQLAGVLARCRAFVSNDSGAMHLAAAIGVPVTAVFGPTDDRVTAPLGPPRGARAPGVLPPLHASRVPDRSPLHERHCRGRRVRGAERPVMKPAVFLDRDGTIIEEAGYLERLERLRFFPFAVDAIRLLNRAGFAVVVITNQAGIARGIVEEPFVAEVSRVIADRVARGGGRIDAFYHCPHHPQGIVERFRVTCDCRKPLPGLFRQAASDRDLDLRRSFTVGDRWHDLAGGHRGRRARRAGADGVRRSYRTGAAARAHRLRGGRQSRGRCGVDSRSGMMADRRTAVDPERLLTIIDGFRGVRVAVVGDLIVDEFIYGDIARVSREAPVLILNYDSTEIVPGGAGNAANNVAALGGSASAVGVLGRDVTGDRLAEVLEARVDMRGIVRPRGFRTPTKTRILAGGIHSAKQQVVRIDRSSGAAPDEADRRALETRLLAAASRADALLVSDYGSGIVTPALVRQARAKLRRRGRRVPPVLVDSRYALLRLSRRSPPAPRTNRRSNTCSASGSARTRACSRKRDGRSWTGRAARRCSSRGAAAAWRSSSAACGPCTFRSRDRIRSRTSPAPATRSSPR